MISVLFIIQWQILIEPNRRERQHRDFSRHEITMLLTICRQKPKVEDRMDRAGHYANQPLSYSELRQPHENVFQHPR